MDNQEIISQATEKADPSSDCGRLNSGLSSANNLSPPISVSSDLNTDSTDASNFGEHDATADDDESIGADEDVADSDELEGLLKDSEMPLTSILAHYGVSPGVATTNGSTTASYPSLRSSRRRSREGTNSAPMEGVTTGIYHSKGTALENGVHRSPLDLPSPLKRSRLSEDAEYIPVLNQNGNIRLNGTGSNSGDQMRKGTLYPSDTTNICSVTVIGRQNSLSPIQHNGISDSGVSPFDRSAGMAESTADAILVTDGDSVKIGCIDVPVGGVDLAEDDSSEPQDEDYVEEEDEDEVRNARFWRHAVGSCESPHSYDSAEDEDYAPSDDSIPDWREDIRVGDAYQAEVPEWLGNTASSNHTFWDTRRFEGDLGLLWQPGKLPESDVIHYEQVYAQQVTAIDLPKENTIDDEGALYALMHANYDIDEALQRVRLKMVTPSDIPSYIETWTEADATAFEKGFAHDGKDFRQIKETRLKHKSMADLVHFYYLWKKTARHDEFLRAYRREKKKSPHPCVTNFMDCLVLEQTEAGRALMASSLTNYVRQTDRPNYSSISQLPPPYGSDVTHEEQSSSLSESVSRSASPPVEVNTEVSSAPPPTIVHGNSSTHSFASAP